MPEIQVEFTGPAGAPLRIEWDENALAGLVTPAPDADPVWHIGGELDWAEVGGLRIVSGRVGGERLLAIAALRPKGAEGHGEELVAGVLGEPGQVERLDEALLSTEYGPDGAPRRIGLELYQPHAELPVRIAGDVVGTANETRGEVRRNSAAFELRSGGNEGVGILDVLSVPQ